jgi:hypothetical protein
MATFPAHGATSWDTPLKAYIDDADPRVAAAIAGGTLTGAALDASIADVAAGSGVNAASDGVLDATTFANAVAEGGEVFVPAGTWDVPTLTIAGPLRLRGAGQGKTILRNYNGSVLSLSGPRIDVSDMTIRSGPEAGAPTIIQTGGVDQGAWERVRLEQLDDDFPMWDNAGYLFIDMRFLNGFSQHTQTATVPTWKLVSAGGLLNSNVWEKWRAQFSGNYHWWLESTTANAQYSATWRDITFEVCTGGGIRLISVRDYLIDNCPTWDYNTGGGGITTGQQHFIYASRNTDNILCVGTIRRVQRLAGANAGGIYDIALSSGGGHGTIIERCRNVSGADPLTIDLAGNSVLISASDPPLTSLTNASAAVVLANGRVSVGSIDLYSGSATPESAITAGPGSLYGRTTGAGTGTLYTKATGTGDTGWRQVAGMMTGSSTLDFASIAAGATAVQTITVAGAIAGDVVILGPPSGLSPGLVPVGFVSATDTVSIRLHNVTAAPIDPASATWKATAIR